MRKSSYLIFNTFESQSKIKLIFIGDIMQHDTQINSAWSGFYYDYSDNFKYVSHLFESVDFVIGNLELTLNGPPYAGYPKFSCPVEFVQELKRNYVNVLVTANNHCYDYKDTGVIKTINKLDDLQIYHTGTFIDEYDYKKNNPLIIENNGVKLALLNYTFKTNVSSSNSNVIINKIDKNKIKNDIETSKSLNSDGIIIYFHWGDEYTYLPNDFQRDIADFCLQHGVDCIIGSHPHFIQPITKTNNSLICYSLGNFISDQITPYTDTGIIVYTEFTKNKGISKLSNIIYLPSWTRKMFKDNIYKYNVIPKLNEFIKI